MYCFAVIRSIPFVVAASVIAASCSGSSEVLPTSTDQVVSTTTAETTTTQDATTTSVAEESNAATTTVAAASEPEAETFFEPTVASQDLEACKLRDQSPDRLNYPLSLITGFPVSEQNFPATGEIIVSLVPIEFEDLPGDELGAERVKTDMQLVSDWYSMVSGGRVSIEWSVSDEWVTIPRNSVDFASDRSRSDDNRLAYEAFTASDPIIDFTGVQAVAFLLPQGQTFMAEGVQGFKHSQFGGSGGFQSEEGQIFNYMIGGAYFDQPYKTLWSYWAHEMGHMFPLPDLYDVRGQWWIGEELEIPGGPFSSFDLMANQDGPSRTLSTWLRFVMGWLDDDQVLCLDAEGQLDGQVMIAPTDSDLEGPKSLMLPLDETRILVVESRRPDLRFDCEGTDAEADVKGVSGPDWRPRHGVIAYVADMTIGHGNGFQALIPPGGRGLNRLFTCSAPPQLDAILEPGDNIVFEGITVEVISSDDYDTVQILR